MSILRRLEPNLTIPSIKKAAAPFADAKYGSSGLVDDKHMGDTVVGWV